MITLSRFPFFKLVIGNSRAGCLAVFGFCYVTRRYGFFEKRDIWRNGAVKVG